MSYLMKHFRKKRRTIRSGQAESQSCSDDHPLTDNLQFNLSKLKDEFGNSKDLVIRQFDLPHSTPIQAAVLHIEGISDEAAIHRSVIRPLMELWYENMPTETSVAKALEMLKDYIITNGNVKAAARLNELKQMQFLNPAIFKLLLKSRHLLSFQL